MSIFVIVNFDVKEESIEELKKYFKEILPGTRSFEGCESLQWYENTESSTKMTMIVKWTSKEAQKKYMTWREETGVLDKITPMLSSPIDLQFYKIVQE